MPDIGVRQLKIYTSRIVREVKERRERYIITHRGRPVAAIIPLEEASQETVDLSSTSAWDELVQLGQEIGNGWQSPQSSADLLSDLRR